MSAASSALSSTGVSAACAGVIPRCVERQEGDLILRRGSIAERKHQVLTYGKLKVRRGYGQG
jgi:hypothetical protein